MSTKRDDWDVSCPDGALQHGPPDGTGRCPWCGNKVDSALRAPRRYPRSELSEAYERHYDPDYGAEGAMKRQHKRETGTNYY
jgi:hypothetical protein